MERKHERELEELELFQKHVADRFPDLLSPPQPSDETPLSISWLRKLLDVFLCCEAEFKAILIKGRDTSQILKPPVDRLIAELLKRTVKALDICNAITNGIEVARHYQKLADIVVTALEKGQVKRAKRALNSLVTALATEEKDSNSCTRTWSFGRRGGASRNNKSTSQLRSLWSVSKNWSAAKQIQAMTTNLVAPQGGGIVWFGFVDLYNEYYYVVCDLHEKISEEWKKKENKGSAGLLDEMQKMEKLSQSLIEFTDSFQFLAEEVVTQVAELAETCRKMEDGLGPLQLQIREVFHRMVRSRAEIYDLLESNAKLCTPMV